MYFRPFLLIILQRKAGNISFGMDNNYRPNNTIQYWYTDFKRLTNRIAGFPGIVDCASLDSCSLKLYTVFLLFLLLLVRRKVCNINLVLHCETSRSDLVILTKARTLSPVYYDCVLFYASILTGGPGMPRFPPTGIEPGSSISIILIDCCFRGGGRS